MSFEDNKVEDIVVRGYFVKDIVAEDSGSRIKTKETTTTNKTYMKLLSYNAWFWKYSKCVY